MTDVGVVFHVQQIEGVVLQAYVHLPVRISLIDICYSFGKVKAETRRLHANGGPRPSWRLRMPI